jgi:diguanylate cyclase (GGDEF)-like protein
VSFPLGDVLLLCVIVGVLTLRGERPGRRWTTLAVGLGVFAVGDMIYLVRLGTGSYEQGTLLDASWVLGLTIVAMAAWQPTPRRSGARTSGALTLVVTVAFSLVALGVLVAAKRYEIGWDAVGLAAATLLAGLLRTVVAFHQVRQLAEVRQQAVTDDLTGLPNRRAFTSAVEGALAAGGHEPGLAVLHIDLDRFKEVNDLFGHHAGDRLLRQIGPRLATALRPGDFLARIDGDEFGLLLAGVDETTAVLIAGRVRDTLATPFVLGDDVQQVAGSVGLALWPAHADNAHGLIQCADSAMSSAKIHRGDVAVYDPVHGAEGRNRLALARQLRPALEAGQFVLHYQPKVDIRSGTVVGVEALVRWQHPRLGLLYPDAFLSIAEQTGSLGLLTEIVLAGALAQGVRWQHDGLDLSVAVNLSASSLTDADLVANIAAALTTEGFPANRLTLEITESALMADRERALATLRAIRGLGITLSVDDYGTGFSSLTYLRDLPVQELKIDRTFVTHVADDRSDAAIVKSTIDLAHSLGLDVVAEGIEDSRALAMLDQYGCDLAQGYYLGRPVAASELTAVLIEGRTRIQPSYARG